MLPSNMQKLHKRSYDWFLLEKFLCGFFTGIILFCTTFQTYMYYHPRIPYPREVIIERLADRIDFIAGNAERKVENQMPPDLDRDKAFHNDRMSDEGLSLKESIPLSCYVIITNGCKGANSVNVTWGKRCNNLRFLLRNNTASCGYKEIRIQSTSIYLPKFYDAALTTINTLHGQESTHWILLATDNSYVIIENVRAILKDKDLNNSTLYGDSTSLSYTLHKGTSSVYVFSGRAVKIYNENKTKQTCNTIWRKNITLYESLCLSDLGISFGTDSEQFNVLPIEFGKSFNLTNESHHIASFRQVNPAKILAFEFYTYHLRPYGVN